MVISRNDEEVFLKSIHIQGFKSFADKIKIDLHPGMSVIVGPNGSGKSNVADAVRWVLGEQSAKSLRGSKMEDVIFAGCSSRRPVGMAEVSLIFNNTTGLFALDYDEVVITRRVYRDGEGQYFINRTPCRLKDIQELFLDTGSGKEGFSIIGQGRVEEILNLRSDERRTLIEEVAGISKFRHRKKEALKKLDDTRLNLERLSDIIAEVESRIEPLAEQAEAARTSQEITAALEKMEISLIVNELSEVNSKLIKARTAGESLNNEFALFAARINEEESKIIIKRHELDHLEQQVQAMQGEVYALENKVSDAEHALSLLSERRGFMQEQSSRLEKELKAAQDNLEFSQEKGQAYAAKSVLLEETLNRAYADLKIKECRLEELRTLSGEARLDEIKTEIFDVLSEKSKLTSIEAETKQKKDTLMQQEKQYQKNIQAKDAEKDSVLREIGVQRDELIELELREEVLNQKSTEIMRSLTAKKTEQQQSEVVYGELLRKADQANARLHALHTLQDNLEGYNKGVREAIIACRKGEITCRGVFGTVADNIEVQTKFELAVETALGAALQNIIVEKTNDAKTCIDYLKRTNNGRATFLPLDAIKGTRQSLDEKTKKHKGFQGLAVDLVKFDTRFGDIMESLLGRILVTDTLDSAIDIAKSNNYRFRIVTLLGDQVNIGGSLTGGSTRTQSSGLLSRVREIEELTAKTREFHEEAACKKQESSLIAKDMEKLVAAQDEIEAEFSQIQKTKGIMAANTRHFEDRLKRLEEDARFITFELNEIRSEMTTLTAIIGKTEKSLKETEDKINALQTEQLDLENLLKEKVTEAQELSDEITSAKVEAARWEQELDQVRQAIIEENEKTLKSQRLMDEKNRELSEVRKNDEEIGLGRIQGENRVKEYNTLLEEKKYQLIELRRAKESFAENNLKQEQDILEMKNQAKEMEAQLHQSELKVTRWEAEWETGNNRLEEEYGLPWKQAQAYLTGDKKESLQETIAAYKQEIEALGPVNYTALEEYPETVKRFEFLTTQKHDLDEAGKTLQELISELDKCMIERFEEGFRSVNAAFKEVFTQLFNGGQAELQLDDPENLLETGVRIVAQPPGKKAQLLSLLSGGERSFTAIALLFAFLKVKPSPFCLLDEIEAALDEANVKRFVNYLRTLSHHTQFILISHRRGTMESADRLYGITMEESGVSKLLTVELEDRAAAAASAVS
ncbi:chromosome segregation protein SMC [Dehalobacter sp. DCM]|uniref:chromosome segregation protein SMC n=1 Tax=Dehalobacter sp. DCM TaxID=2907827 RepID=UPI0030821594|nr:chromosome segregation protein SMC [Dehalobacter sp. DCM]